MALISLRLLIAFLSSGIVTLFTQVAVFIYTRSEKAAIPVGEIVGLSSKSAGTALGVIWFLVMLCFFTFSLLRSVFRSNVEGPLFPELSSSEARKSILFFSVVPTVAAIAVVIALMFCSTCTANVLRFLGYGGGDPVCIDDGAFGGPMILLAGDYAYLQNFSEGYSRITITEDLSIHCGDVRRLEK